MTSEIITDAQLKRLIAKMEADLEKIRAARQQLPPASAYLQSLLDELDSYDD